MKTSAEALHDVVCMLWGELKGHPIKHVGIRVADIPHEGTTVYFEACAGRKTFGFAVSLQELLSEGNRFEANARIRAACNLARSTVEGQE